MKKKTKNLIKASLEQTPLLKIERFNKRSGRLFEALRYSGNQSVDISDSEDEDENDYQTIVFQPENEEDEEREKSQSDKIDLEINKKIPVPIIID